MCWSFEVSITTTFLVYLTFAFLCFRNKTRRDIWNAIFLSVFGSMQLIDAILWKISETEDLSMCSRKNHLTTMCGFIIIMFEPVACFLGRCYANKYYPTGKELLTYFLLFFGLPSLWKYVFIFGTCNPKSCTILTENNHLMLGIGQDSNGGIECWRTFEGCQAEIPLAFRLLFLGGMVYQYLQSNILGSGLLQSSILIATWIIGYLSDSHANIWCLANVLQIITMIIDPYIFPENKKGSSYKRSERQSILQDRFSKRNVPRNLDAIIIGSGIGGLTTGALLARNGQKVLVLEQHYRAGGCTHTFDEFGNIFDSGIHYVGSKSLLDRLLSYISDRKIKFAPMGSAKNKYHYDTFDLGDGCIVKFRKGRQELINELIRLFPHEKNGILQYMELLQKASSCAYLFGLMKLMPGSFSDFLFRFISDYTRLTSDQVVKMCVKDRRLVALLSGGQLIDWNLQPDKTSWFVTAGMMNYYMDGGFYPLGGSHNIAKNVIPVIEQSGGRVLCRALVTKILFNEKNEAYGVEMKNGSVIVAKKIISNAGAINTYQKLVPEQVLNDVGLDKKFDKKIKQSNGHITAFVSLNGTSEECGLDAANIHSMPDLPVYGDISKMQEDFYKDPFSHECLMTLTSPSAKDPEYKEKYPNCSDLLLLIEAKWDWFKDIDIGHYGARAEEYKAYKDKFSGMFLERMYKYYPKTLGKVKSIEIGTPITTKHFLNAPKGASYGLEWTPEHFNEELLKKYFIPKTKLPNLYLTGEASFFGGFCGATISGYITAYKIIGLSGMLKILFCSGRT